MSHRIARILAAFSLGFIALAPLTANAQYTGTNGQIFFDYNVLSGSTTIASVAAANPDGSESHMIAQGTDDGTNYVQYNSAAVSPDGSKVAYVKSAGNYTNGADQYSIIVANADGTSPTTTYTAPAVSGGFDILSRVIFSSDGTKLFFIQYNNPSGNTDGIYSVATTGGSATQLVTSDQSSKNTIAGGLAVSATRIYYGADVITNSGSTNTFEVDSAHTDGTSQATLFTAGVGFANQVNVQDVSPDASKLLYSRQDGSSQQQLSTVDTATGTTVTTLTTLTSNSDYISRASYSPDATKIVFAYNSFGNPEVIAGGNVINANGSGLTVVRADEVTPFWSATTVATAGTYPTPLVLGETSASGGRAGGGDPNLPDAGKPSTNLPIALGLVGLLAAAGIETARRVRRRA